MNEKDKKEYLKNYKEAKNRGVPFFPNIIYKDALIALVVFLVLAGLAYFAGVPLEERANPADTTYTPRPEWYFLFLYQLLKYFPGQLEVIGVVVLPTVAILLLIGLPFLDRSKYRHFLNRPFVSGITALAFVGIGLLTLQSVREAPPPSEADQGDPVAALYTENCAGCHGPDIQVPQGANLHEIIAQGSHDGMPAWNGDLTTNEIDALAGFILSPSGNSLFSQFCGDCHQAPELVSEEPLQLKQALEQGNEFPDHADQDIPDWNQAMTNAERSALLNFLAAPDGQRLFTVNCAECHGQRVAFSGSEVELRTIIEKGGLHLEMPPWQGDLSSAQIETLAQYVVDPSQAPEGESLFQDNCAACHGERIPTSQSVPDAVATITSGGPHQTMPVWGNILTQEQLDALVQYTLQAAKGESIEMGQELFTSNCSGCHGQFGEGGPNPTRPDDIIAPISTGEYLNTRDDVTLRSIISQGQPNFGMSPFGSAYGGPLEDDEIQAIVAYIRSWEANPPVELPPEVKSEAVSLNAPQVYADVCAQCHGLEGKGTIGPSLVSESFQDGKTDQEIFDTINLGHDASPMIAWGEVLSSEQIQGLVEYIRELGQNADRGMGIPSDDPDKATPSTEPTSIPAASEPVSFSEDVMPIFEQNCAGCHGSMGGWDASSYESVMTTGNNAPTVIPSDVEGSLLAQKIQGTQSDGSMMPPGEKLPDEDIQIILDWIQAGAQDN
jgi:mono/diheme cytochrome c family protein